MTLFWPHERGVRGLHDILRAPASRRIGVCGLGVVGTAVARFLAKRGARVFACDQRESIADLEALQTLGVEVVLGAGDEEELADRLAGMEALAIGPGVDPRQSLLAKAHQAEVPLFGELELHGVLPMPTIAVTGTNGKSTTVALIGALLEGIGLRPFVGGNLGPCITTWVEDTGGAEHDVAVLELSSFQLERAYTFRCQVAAVLNLSPDHTDRYDDMGEYARAKFRWLQNLSPSDVLLLGSDQALRRLAEPCAAQTMVFGATVAELASSVTGVAVAGDRLTVRGDRRAAAELLESFPLHHPHLLGGHNRLNAAAALLAVVGLGQSSPALADKIDVDRLKDAYLGFGGLAHRLEFVGDIDGVQFINDSKATNDESTATALRAMTRPVILLLGGRDKGGGYDESIRAAASLELRGVIAFGEAGGLIATAWRAVAPSLELVVGLMSAFAQAVSRARSGDVVLLSPACSSFDEFSDYAERGRVFKALVAAAAEERPAPHA